MDSTRKKRSALGFATELDGVLREMMFKRPKEWLANAREKMRDLPKTNFDLGCDFADKGQWFDAALRFRVTLYLQPGYPKAWYNLGCSYFRLNKKPESAAALKKALAQTPGDIDTIFMLAVVDPASVPANARPQTMPPLMVTQFFASIAPHYDAMELQNQYHGGAVVAEQIKSLMPATPLSIVDLGCGSGIAARPWRALARDMVGVDCTKEMVAMAQTVSVNNQKLYDRVMEADARLVVESIPAAAAQLVLAVNVAQFIGGLGELCVQAARLLAPTGVFAITVEPFTTADGFGLMATSGRFGHSVAYVKQMAAAAGLTLAKEAAVQLYPNTNAALLVFQKGAA